MSAPIDVSVPGDKSITHRALLLAGLADGDSRLAGLLDAADIRATRGALAALGVAVAGGPESAVVSGRGLRGWTRPGRELDCGNSGTTARLLLGALAGTELDAVLTGDVSLRQRPMRRVTDPLSSCGATYEELDGAGRLPIRVRGTRSLTPIEMFNTRSSAQVKTAMLLAGLTAGVAVRVTESGRPRDHTERMLAAMGAAVRTAPGQTGDVVTLEPPERLAPLDLTVPGDISSAAFFLALGALTTTVRVRGVGLNPTRTGALDVLARMGAAVRTEPTGEVAGEPVGDVTVGPGPLTGTVVQGSEVPTLLDEIPVLAVVAARARGTTRFEGVGELRVKESDRIGALAENLQRLGVDVEEARDRLVVHGTEGELDGDVDARGDHRIAMAFGVLDAAPDSRVRVTDRDAVAVSFPGFWQELDRVRAAMEAP